MRSSFNAYGKSKLTFENHNVPVWLGVVTPVPVGGVLASAYAKAGAFFAAGTPVNLAGGVLTPLVLFKVKSVSGTSATVHCYSSILPAVGESVKTLSASGSAGSANAITAVVDNGDGTAVLTLTTATTANTILALNAEIVPNGYLYNDIEIDANATEDISATGAVVKAHIDGILIDRTPAAEIATYMATKVPGVVQVNG